MYKFRAMTDERDENGELLLDEVRLTKFGKWLRNTSLDELPEPQYYEGCWRYNRDNREKP